MRQSPPQENHARGYHLRYVIHGPLGQPTGGSLGGPGSHFCTQHVGTDCDLLVQVLSFSIIDLLFSFPLSYHLIPLAFFSTADWPGSSCALCEPTRICENPDGTFSLQTRDQDSDWHAAYEGAACLSRSEAVHAMELWRNGLGYVRVPNGETCDTSKD
jgi:hypothetical protein